MVKRVLLGVGVATVLGVLIFGRNAGSYLATSFGWARDKVHDSVPLEFEIDRARKMVAGLAPDIKKNMHVIAQEEVEVERLEKRIAASETQLDKDQADLMRLKTDLASGKNTFKYAGHTYSADQVQTDLTNRFARYQTADETLKSLRDMHAARTRSLESAKQKLDGMVAAKRQLEVEVENLEARLKAIEVAQTTSDYNFDDSQLARTKELINDLQTRLEVDEKLVNAETTYQGEIQLEEPASENIVDRVSQYFGEDTQGAPQVADATPASDSQVQ